MADTETTPAGELRAAASLLCERVDAFRSEAAVSPYWRGFAEYAHGVDNAMGGAGGRLAMLFTPEAAEALAAWLEQAALWWDQTTVVLTDPNHVEHDACGGVAGEDCQCFAHPLAVARALNGSVS